MLILDQGMYRKIREAMGMIQTGVCKRVDVSDTVKVYACKNIIRVDIKCEGV